MDGEHEVAYDQNPVLVEIHRPHTLCKYTILNTVIGGLIVIGLHAALRLALQEYARKK